MNEQRPVRDEVSDLSDHRDRRSIADAAAGDERAFASLFRIYGPAALGLALRITGDKTLAEEVVQEVFLNVWRRAGSYDLARGTVRAWLLMQVHHRAVDVVRREQSSRRREENVGPVLATLPTDEDVVEEQWIASRRRSVRKAMIDLPTEQRVVLELAYFQGLTQAQIAEQTGAPIGTVKSRTLGAFRRLRQSLAQEEA